MRSTRRWPKLLLLVVLAAACRRYIRIDDPQTLEYHPVQADQVHRWRSDLRADLQSARFALRLDGAPAAGWTVVARFVHVSDVQIRDRGLHYFGKLGEDLTDTVASSTRRSESLDANDEYPFLALVGAVNAVADSDGPPDFLVHTGDAADANSVGELVRFITVANELHIPWFDVIGNHDLFLMGNFTEDEIIIQGAPADGLPWVLNRSRFMELHGANGTIPSSHPPTESPTESRVPASRYHGFDCLGPTCKQCGEGGFALRPYYSVALDTTPRLRLVVLDTTIPHERVPRLARREIPGFGASGYVDAEQFRWLQRELASAHDRGEAVLVFGHHPLTVASESPFDSDLRGTNPDGKADASVLALLKADRNVLGYFGGHTHSARIARHADPYRGAYPLVEVIAPSLHEYPQAAYWVEVVHRGDELALRVRPVKGVTADVGTPVAKRIATACAGARVDAKLGPEGDCFTDVSLVPQEAVARVPLKVELLVAEAGGPRRELDCGTFLSNASAACTPPRDGASARRAGGGPEALTAGKRAEWSGGAECGAAAALVTYGAKCTLPAARSVALSLSSSLSARTPDGGTARAELAPEWTVPIDAPAGGARIRVKGPPAETLACRARLDAFGEAPIAEKPNWVVERAGLHALVIRCETVQSTCGGEGPCARDRPLEATLEVGFE
jgi:3',5'-cyclic AMP phosphodiesterase CpdA